ncbi:hypothetical protein MTO96_003488 [Rhipicephalus appendiculatus]
MAFNSLAVELPTKHDFRKPEDWTRWHRRWERYRLISGLTGQHETTQINTLLYAMGEEAMRLLEYDYSMSHTPGNKLYTADLSREPSEEPADERTLEAAVHEYEELVLEQLPASNHLLNRIRTSIQSDRILSKVATVCTTSWPTVHGLSPDLKRQRRNQGATSYIPTEGLHDARQDTYDLCKA